MISHPLINQIDEDRHDYTSLTNVEPDTNLNFNTNQTICKKYNGKEFNDMSDLPFHNISIRRNVRCHEIEPCYPS